MRHDIANKLTKHLETGTSAWTGGPIIRYPQKGSPVFLELLERHKEVLNYEGITTFFEAGTFNGNNAADFAEVFDKVVTAENNEAAYNLSVDTHGHNKKICFKKGDATTVLTEYLIENPNERLVILLDDHNNHNSFIKQELETINKHSSVDHIIVIDDVAQFGKGAYPTHQEVADLVSQAPHGYKIISDSNHLLIYASNSRSSD